MNYQSCRTECIDHGRTGQNGGYARIKYLGNNEYAHRVSYCLAHGVTLDSIKHLVVRHDCDNPRCINPNHLRLGTIADNMKDVAVRRRRKIFTVEQERKICAVYAAGNISRTELAKRLGIGRATLGNILRRKD